MKWRELMDGCSVGFVVRDKVMRKQRERMTLPKRR